MGKARHRRHSTELKLRLAQAYLNGEGSLKSIAKQHDISPALLMIWVDKFRRAELTEDIDQDEKIREYAPIPDLGICPREWDNNKRPCNFSQLHGLL